MTTNLLSVIEQQHKALEQTQVEALHVGDSSFEDWYQSYPRQGISKQVARDAYAAGMGDPLVATHPQATEPAPSTEDYWTKRASHLLETFKNT